MPRGLDDEERLRRLIVEYFGAHSRLRVLRRATAFGAPVFVVDFDRGAKHYRTFGSFGPSFGTSFLDEPQLTEQSSMDLLPGAAGVPLRAPDVAGLRAVRPAGD